MNNISHDESEPLNAALNVTRQEIIGLIESAQNDRNTALQAKEIAGDDKAVATIDWRRAEDSRTVCAEIGEEAEKARLTVENLAAFAGLSTSAATATAAAMATAAGSIKDAAAALETLTKSAYGITALAHSNDKGTEIDKAARAAKKMLTSALESVNKLKSTALEGSVCASQSLAGTVTEAFSLVKTQIENVDADATTALARANDLAAKNLQGRRTTAEFFATQILPIAAATVRQTALKAALADLDTHTGGEVVVHSTNTPSLRASWQPSPEDKAPSGDGKWNGPTEFIAVEKETAPQFKLPEDYKTSLKGRFFGQEIEITKDNTGAAISFEKSYCVFALRKYTNEEGGNTPVLSLPSAPVLVRWACPALKAPTVVRLEADAFVVAVQGVAEWKQMFETNKKQTILKNSAAKYDDDSVEFRLFIVPSALLHPNPLDDQFLAEEATPASYVTLSPSSAVAQDKISALETQLMKLNGKDIRTALRQVVRKEMETERVSLNAVLAADSIVAYFSPYALPVDPPAKPTMSLPVIGSYSDAFGNPLDLSAEDYSIAVLVVLKAPTGDPKTPEMILSEYAAIPKTTTGGNAGKPAPTA